jgi:transcriptional regulator with XRE-family HTH domain
VYKDLTPNDKDTIRRVGMRIKKLRNIRGFSQDQLAIEAEIPKNQIGRIERAEINTSIVTLSRIATALGIHLKELFDI